LGWFVCWTRNGPYTSTLAVRLKDDTEQITSIKMDTEKILNTFKGLKNGNKS